MLSLPCSLDFTRNKSLSYMLGNHSSATEFYLLGFSGSRELRHILFATFFFFYLVTLMGNTVITVIVCLDKHLQSPMYFFLGHLSALELLVTTIIIPMMLWGLLLPGMPTISLAACVASSSCTLLWGPQSLRCWERWLWTVTWLSVTP